MNDRKFNRLVKKSLSTSDLSRAGVSMEAEVAKKMIKPDEDFGLMMNCAVRYGLWRMTYITKAIPDYLIPLIEQGVFSRNTLIAMDRDLTTYEEDRAYMLEHGAENEWSLDNDCDYENWKRLHEAVKKKLEEKK